MSFLHVIFLSQSVLVQHHFQFPWLLRWSAPHAQSLLNKDTIVHAYHAFTNLQTRTHLLSLLVCPNGSPDSDRRNAIMAKLCPDIPGLFSTEIHRSRRCGMCPRRDVCSVALIAVSNGTHPNEHRFLQNKYPQPTFPVSPAAAAHPSTRPYQSMPRQVTPAALKPGANYLQP